MNDNTVCTQKYPHFLCHKSLLSMVTVQLNITSNTVQTITQVICDTFYTAAPYGVTPYPWGGSYVRRPPSTWEPTGLTRCAASGTARTVSNNSCDYAHYNSSVSHISVTTQGVGSGYLIMKKGISRYYYFQHYMYYNDVHLQHA